jgi:hypothetical protein
VIAVIGLVVVGIVGYFLLHHSNNNGSTGTLPDQSNSVSVANMRNLAAIEDSAHASTGTYPDEDAIGSRFTLVAGSEGGIVLLGVNPSKGYCVVASDPPSETSKTWYLYDSQHGGLQANTYDSPYVAQDACSDHSITAGDFTTAGLAPAG